MLDQLTAALTPKYQIVRELGRGGMATVYLADDLKHHRKVAIKVLHPDLAAGLGAERFLREIETAARLHHPHILPLHDSGDADGFLYYVMPYVEGESLRDRLDREKQLPLEDALSITREVADALQYAHDHDVLHRDIKPDNIMLESGHATVADFGVARAVTEAGGESLTSTGLAVGTPTYMSPEQAAAEKNLDGRSDLYSLGCLLYEMLAGEPPHTGPTAQAILARRLSEPAPSLRAVRDSVPESVHQTLAQSLSRTPADRPASVAQFAAALGRTAAPALPHRRPLAGALIALAVAAVMGVGYLVIRDRGPAFPASESSAEPGVAVLPFQVVGDDLDYMNEGIVHLLSFNLDGVAGIRKIDPQSVLHAWKQASAEGEEPSPEAAIGAARRVAARYVITGSAVSVGPDLRLIAEVFDVERGKSRGSAQVAGPADDLSALVDQLTLELLRLELVPADPDQPQVNLSRVTTGSLQALKAYLAGEQEYQQANWDEAAREFRQAVDLDSTFARAWYRLGWAHTWNEDYVLGAEYQARAASMANGLPVRDSLLLVAAGHSGPEAIATLQVLTKRYPDDVDGWHLLGDNYFHDGGKLLAPAGDFRHALMTAIDLSPQYGESYIHSIEDAFIRLDSARTRELIDGYGGIDLETPPCPGFGLVWDMVWGDSASQARAGEVVWADPETMECAWVTAAAAPQAFHSIERIHLATIGNGDLSLGNRLFRLWRTMQGRLMSGQVAAAQQAIALAETLPDAGRYTAHWDIMLYLSGLAGPVPPQEAVDRMTQAPGPLNGFWLGALAVSEERWEDVEQAARSIESDYQLRGRWDSLEAESAGALAAGLRAYAAVMRDSAIELTEFEAALRELPTASFVREYPQQFLRYMVGRMLFERGELRQAERYFRSFYQYDFTHFVPAQYYLGQIYEALDRPEEAAVHYQLFVDWWRDADPELHDLWDEGRDGLARVTGEPRASGPE